MNITFLSLSYFNKNPMHSITFSQLYEHKIFNSIFFIEKIDIVEDVLLVEDIFYRKKSQK